MGKITDISKQKRNKTRVNVFIDGEFVCGLDEVAAASARLKIGDEISPEVLKSVVRRSEVNSAFERAVTYLSAVPRAKREIERYLSDKGYDKDVVGETLDRLVAYHYIDDRLYAETYFRSASKKYGSFRIAAELKKRGVDKEIIDELIENGGEDEIYSVACKYISSHRTADRQKLKRFLAGRGFSWDSISAAVSRLDDEGYFSDEEDFS